MNPCACGEVNLQTALSVWADSVQHFEFIRIATDDLLIDGGVA